MKRKITPWVDILHDAFYGVYFYFGRFFFFFFFLLVLYWPAPLYFSHPKCLRSYMLEPMFADSLVFIVKFDANGMSQLFLLLIGKKRAFSFYRPVPRSCEGP